MNPVDEAIYIPKKRYTWNPCDAFLVAVFLEKDKAIQKSRECYATVELNGSMTRGQVVIYHVTGSQKEHNLTVIENVNSDICKNLLLWTATP